MENNKQQPEDNKQHQKSADRGPRLVAYELLLRVARDGSYANLALDAALRRERLSGAGAAFCTALVYGVIERRRTLDYQLGDLLSKPLNSTPPQALAALRMGLYQLYYMDVPAHAAIHESVELVKRTPARHAAGMVNAVLRKAAARELRLPDREEDEIAYLSIRYACPDWLARLWTDAYGPEHTEALLMACLGGAPAALRVNISKTDAEALRA
ncbi:MAG: 16S rRNA (cytosine(967)-C(5))-methyltransferase RsmB, partial [Oscillospiraceae bacterium]|nr:16S rRNA (cytosine(967)-C(5))-methyltransferase RsmB [Oscillospiraceae bacterium]